MIIEPSIEKYFGFLQMEYNFDSPISYSHIGEIHTVYAKGNIVVKIVYDGFYSCEVLKLPNNLKDILPLKTRIDNLLDSEIDCINLSKFSQFLNQN